MRQRKRLTLVRARILEQDDPAFLQVESRLLCYKQVRTLNNVLKVRFAFCVGQRSNVGYVDSLRAPTTRHEQVRFEPEMGPISEICAIQNNLTGCC